MCVRPLRKQDTKCDNALLDTFLTPCYNRTTNPPKESILGPTASL